MALKLIWRQFLSGVFPDLAMATRLSGEQTIEGETLTLGEIARRFGGEYEQRHAKTMRPEEVRTLRALAACRTALCGWHRYRCDHCGHEAAVCNSCGDRHCPTCQNAKRAAWLQRRREELLAVPYFHLIVPLPAEVSQLALYNRRLVYDLLFDKVSEMLKDVAASHGIAEIGFFGVLHTWGQKLQHHAHVHFVMVGGGISPDGQWVSSPDNFFLPIPVMRNVFRAKMLEALLNAQERGKLHFGGELSHLAQPAAFHRWWGGLLLKDWVVHVKPPVNGNPDVVLKYLARYVYRTGISNGRLLRLEGDQVTFSYRDYHEPDSPEKKMTLPADRFLGRFLQHVLPKGLMGVRHFGFLGGSGVAQRLERLRKLIAASTGQQASAAPLVEHTAQSCSPEQGSASDFARAPSTCPECGKGPMREIGEGPRRACEEVRKLVWDVFPPWPVPVEDSS